MGLEGGENKGDEIAPLEDVYEGWIDENDEKIQALIKAVMSEEVKAYINETYSGAVVPIF